MVISIIVFSLTLFGIVAIVLFLIRLSYKYDIRPQAHISFEEFKSIYEMAPDKWINQPGDDGTWYHAKYFDGKSWNDCYMSTMIDYWKLRRFFNNVIKNEDEQKSAARKEHLIKYWKDDVEEYKKRTYKEMRNQLRADGIALFTNDQMRFLRQVLKSIDKEMTDEEIEKAVNSIDLTDYIVEGGKK